MCGSTCEYTSRVKATLAPEEHDAYFQLVEHPILALSNLYHLYYALAWNRRLAAANDPRANLFADRAQAAFRRDQEITDAYHALNGGKWGGMMLQTHIGYTSWQEPRLQVMPVQAGFRPDNGVIGQRGESNPMLMHVRTVEPLRLSPRPSGVYEHRAVQEAGLPRRPRTSVGELVDCRRTDFGDPLSSVRRTVQGYTRRRS